MDAPTRPGVPTLHIAKRAIQPVTRLATVSPYSGEIWYLRLLLAHYPTREYDSLLTFHDETTRTIVPCGSFQEMASRLGLIVNNNEASITLQEARNLHHSPASLRCLLISVAVGGFAVVEAFDTHRDYLACDYTDRGHSPSISDSFMLQDLDSRLQQLGCNSESVGLPAPARVATQHDLAVQMFSPPQQQEEYHRLYISCNSD